MQVAAYRIAEGVTKVPIDPSKPQSGWLIERSEHNAGRGDRASIRELRASLRELSLLKEIRRGPFLVATAADNLYGAGKRCKSLHGATINDALREEWAENSACVNIRSAVAVGCLL